MFLFVMPIRKMELLSMGRKYKAILMFKSRMAMSFVLEEMNIYCNCVRRKNMEFQCGVVSDVGTTRKVNQDSACGL